MFPIFKTLQSRKLQPSRWYRVQQCLVGFGMMIALVSSVQAEKTKTKLTLTQEAKRKCPQGPQARCGELVGSYPQHKGRFPPVLRKIGGFDYLIPTEFFQNLDPTGYSNQLTAYWIPLSYLADGGEAPETVYARESIKYGLMWPYGVRIKIQTNRYPVKNPSSYSNCAPQYIAKDPFPLPTSFDMTMYRDRSFDNEKKHGKTIDLDACFVSDDPKYSFYPGVPVTYWVHPHYIRGGKTSSPDEERAVAGFTLRDDKVYVEYMFQTALFPYWKEIHRAVLKLIKSWEQ